MKTFSLFTAVTLFAGALLTAAYAQSNVNLRVTVPFQFKAGGTDLPAGDYNVVSISTPGVIRVYDEKTYRSVLVQFRGNDFRERAQRTSLTFHRYNDRYFLESIARRGDSSRMEMPKSRDERELEQGGARPIVTMLVARSR